VEKFKVYIAATSAGDECARVAAATAALDSYGIEVTSTWARTVAEVGNANPPDASTSDRRTWSTQCTNEIDAADAVWFLVPPKPVTTRGAWFEAGYAFSEKKHLVFSGDTKQSVFGALGAEFETDAGALAHIRNLAGLRELAEAPAMDLRLKNALMDFDLGGEG